MHASGRMRIAKRYFAARTPLSILFPMVYGKAKGMLRQSVRQGHYRVAGRMSQLARVAAPVTYSVCDECSLSFSMQG